MTSPTKATVMGVGADAGAAGAAGAGWDAGGVGGVGSGVGGGVGRTTASLQAARRRSGARRVTG
jgi:hypothetical protein